MPEAESDFDVATCLARVAHGDQTAAAALVERMHPLVLRLVRAHRPQSCAADDLAQEVLIRMFARLDRYQCQRTRTVPQLANPNCSAVRAWYSGHARSPG